MNKKIASLMLILVIILPMLSSVSYSPTANSTINALNTTKFDFGQDYFNENAFSAITFEGVMNITTFAFPESGYKILLDYINSAMSEIDIEIYAITHPVVLKALNDAFKRNSSIVINVILDKKALGLQQGNTYTAYNLTQAGATVVWSNSTEYDFTHAKFAIFDRKTVLIDSGNWAASTLSKNREWVVVINEQSVVNYFLDVFSHDFAIATPYDEATDGTGSPVSTYVSLNNNSNAKTFVEQAKVTPVLSPDTSETLIRALINSANETLEIEIPYIRYWGSDLNPFVEDLIDAAQRGVQVRVIIGKNDTESFEHAKNMTQYGIAVAVYEPTGGDMHNKGIIVDGKMVLICSINWSETSVKENREAGVIIENENITQYYLALFNDDWNKAEHFPYNDTAGPTIEVTYYPTNPTSDDDVTVYAEINDLSGISTAILSYQVDSGDWTNITMTYNGENYTATIPKQSAGSTVHFKVYAEDNQGNWAVSNTVAYTVQSAGEEEEGEFPIIYVAVAVIIGIAIAIFAPKLKGKTKTRSKRRRKR
ncbi:MAG: phospholipase D-like domain-containing protein [Candidatus Asgardarchaeia archaeon]